MGQALNMCIRCETKRDCYDCADLHQWIMDHLDAEPVRHGRWKRYGKNLGECSKCGYIVNIRYKYCPNCGANMRGENDE